MPVQEGGRNAGAGQKEDIGAAINFAKENPGALVSAVRTLVAFVTALFSKSGPK